MAVTEEQRAMVLTKLESGATLRAACRAANVPEASHVLRIASQDEEFAAQYLHARAMGYTLVGDQLTDIADDMDIPADQKRHMLDTRKWMLAKMLPKIYGDTQQVTHTIQRGESVLSTLELEQIVQQARIQVSDVSDAVLVDNSSIAPSIAHDAGDSELSA